MIFNTWTFLIFAVPAISAYWLVVPRSAKPYYLVGAGTFFYAYSVPAYLALVLFLGVVTFAFASAMLRIEGPARKWLMTIAVSFIIGALAFFKYSSFFTLSVNQIAAHNILPVPHLIVPLAISFFTFEFVHVLVDVYLGKIARLDVRDFAVFTMFFPTMVAGPIKRYESFAPQVRCIEEVTSERFALNLYRITIGLAKKVIIADSMTILTGPLTSPDSAPWGRIDYWVAVLAYTTKIYFDFSGYSDIAIGLGGILGLRIPENFDRPYWAWNISEFWRRWHISLSSWIRDYIFIPLGGSRGSRLVTAVNLFVAMALAGLWHGAAWSFVVWGLWHGLGLAVHRLWNVIAVPRFVVLQRQDTVLRSGSIALTFTFVAAGWILFAAASFSDAVHVVLRAF